MKYLSRYIIIVLMLRGTVAFCQGNCTSNKEYLWNNIPPINATNGSYYPILNSNIFLPEFSLSSFAASQDIPINTDSSYLTSFINYNNLTLKASAELFITPNWAYRYVNNTNVIVANDTSNWGFVNVNTPEPLPCMSNDSLPIYPAPTSNNYFGYSLTSKKITNIVDTSFLFNPDSTITRLTSSNQFIKESIKPKPFFFINNECINRLLPSCNSYKLSFYIRPSYVFNYALEFQVDSNTKFIDTVSNYNCLFFEKDIQFIDSFNMQLFSTNYIMDSSNAVNITLANDTSRWTLIEKTFNTSDSIGLVSLEATVDLDSLLYNYRFDFDYVSYIDSIESTLSNTSKAYLMYFNLAYLFDSISITPVGYDHLNLCIADTNLCYADTIEVSAFHPDYIAYNWSTGDTTPTTQIYEPGIYTIEATYPCGRLCHTFTVHPKPPSSLLSYADTIQACPNILPLTLSVHDTLSNISWNTGDTTQTITVNQSGYYIASMPHPCDTVKDSVWVEVLEAPILNLVDSFYRVCDTLTLNLPDTFQSYLWSNGSIESQAVFTESGNYSVEIKDSCYTYSYDFEIEIERLAIGRFEQRFNFCPNDFPVAITAPILTDNHYWLNTLDTTTNFILDSIGNKVLTHLNSNLCGVREDVYFVNVYTDTLNRFPEVFIEDKCVEQGIYEIITQISDTNFIYQWEGRSSLNFSTSGGQNEVLTISNPCKTYTIDTLIPPCPDQIAYALPTAFSPNGDGVNDSFGLLYLSPKYRFQSLKIYNRWGELVFYSTDINKQWLGIFKGANLEIGTYTFKLELLNTSNHVEIFSGNVSLLK